MLIKVCAAKNIRFGLNSQPEVVWTPKLCFPRPWSLGFEWWPPATQWWFWWLIDVFSSLWMNESCGTTGIQHWVFFLHATAFSTWTLLQEGTQWGFNCHGGDFGNAMHAELWAAQNIKFWMTSQAAMAFTAQTLLCKTAKFRLWVAIIWCLFMIFVNDWCF